MEIEKTLKYRFYKYVKYHKQELSINQIMDMWESYFDSISYNDLTARYMLISSLHAHDILLPYLKIMAKQFVNNENLTSCVEKLFEQIRLGQIQDELRGFPSWFRGQHITRGLSCNEIIDLFYDVYLRNMIAPSCYSLNYIAPLVCPLISGSALSKVVFDLMSLTDIPLFDFMIKYNPKNNCQ